MNVEDLQLSLRPRSNWQAVDLGFAVGRELAYAVGLQFGLMLVMIPLTLLMGSGESILAGILAGVVVGLYIVVLVLGVIFMIKRWHDMNRSGWYSLLLFIPLVNIIVGLVMLFVPGTDGPNDYGQPSRPTGTTAGIAVVLFFVVFIGGILAAVAIPAYQDYVQAAEQAAAQQ